jgi:glycosyltransferase involved in cell wall biosynthesis
VTTAAVLRANRSPLRFCLVTSAHICNNPRLVKEADALHDAGHDVRVVAIDADAVDAARDDMLMRGRHWRLDRVSVARHGNASRLRWLTSSVAQAAARRAFDRGVFADRLRDQAASRFVRHLARAAAAEPADVYIGHNLEALPAVIRVARTIGARVGFDLEDLYSGELPDDSSAEARRRLVVAVERRYLPDCDFLLASSDGIADEVVARYGVARPHVVHNVFPLAHRMISAREEGRRGTLSLYWYSQVIGPGRGLEEAVTALSMLPSGVHLHLRGRKDETYTDSLVSRAGRLGVADRVHLLDPAPPEALVALAAQHDVGLALEQPATLNRRLCITNKLFTYLLAGVAVAATDTPGQRSIMSRIPGAGFTYSSGDALSLAAGLRSLVEDGAALEAAKRAAYDYGTVRYCWEQERSTLLAAMTAVAAAAGLDVRSAS